MIRRLLSIAFFFALATPLALSQASAWKIDPAHSEVDFVVRHMGISNVHGRFGIASGTIQLDQTDAAKSSVQVTIDVNSIDTGVASRDKDLKGASFFEADKYPTATFTSTSVEKKGDGFAVTGNLTLHGVTKPVILQVEAPEGPVNGMGNKQHIGYSASTTISRTAFGIGTKFPNAMLSDEIKLTIEVDAVKE
jgi:polyisoprenoid-binding protein YceI